MIKSIPLHLQIGKTSLHIPLSYILYLIVSSDQMMCPQEVSEIILNLLE